MSVCQATAARCQGGRRLQPAGHPRATAADGRPAPGRFLAAKWQIISRYVMPGNHGDEDIGAVS